MEQKIYLWGDSIGQGVVYDPERRRYRLGRARCEKLLRERGVPLECHARMGATVDRGYADFAAAPAAGPGLAVIEFGGNDCDLDWRAVSARPEVFHDGKTPIGEFGAMLELFAQSARERGLEPVLVLPPPIYPERYFEWVCRGLDREAVRAYLGDVGHIGRWHGCYVEAIRRAARAAGAAVRDLHTPFMQAMNYPDLMGEDGIHPTEAGQELMARVAMRAMAEGKAGIRNAEFGMRNFKSPRPS